MKAAVVTSFDQPPHYGDFPDPVPERPDEMLVDVLAAGLHHLTRSRAAGLHYSSIEGLPLVPGVDGVGRGTDGKLRYFSQAPRRIGTMADKTVIELDHSIELPSGSNPITVAAAMNPGMASWLALRCRVPFQPGQSVLILGATGSSGSMAVQIARHLGASQIIAVGRDALKLAKLPALGATDIVPLEDARLGVLARQVDVVLDFIWGGPAVRVMEDLLKQRADRSQPLIWIHLGSMAGNSAAIPGAFLRSANFRIVGSGHGAVSKDEILSALPALAKEIAHGTFHMDAKAVSLRNVELAWSAPNDGGERTVFIP
ncbi:MAG: zinc-binding alcohol dehydrogenase family protein [Stenotrophomonas sp.]